MNHLKPHAREQAKLDAAAKVIRSSDRRSALRWLLAQRLRTQFLIVIAGLFAAYAGASAILTATGLRAPPQRSVTLKKKPVPICSDAGMPVSERARCIADHDPPVVIRRVGTETRINAEKASHARTSEEDRFKLQQELARLRDAKRFQALQQEFGRRIAEMISGALKLPDDASRQAYYEDTVVVMAEMLQLSDHPMKHSRGQPLSGDFYPDRPAAATPPGGVEAERHLNTTCGSPPMPPDRRQACAAALRDHVFQLRYAASNSTLLDLALTVRP